MAGGRSPGRVGRQNEPAHRLILQATGRNGCCATPPIGHEGRLRDGRRTTLIRYFGIRAGRAGKPSRLRQNATDRGGHRTEPQMAAAVNQGLRFPDHRLHQPFDHGHRNGMPAQAPATALKPAMRAAGADSAGPAPKPATLESRPREVTMASRVSDGKRRTAASRNAARAEAVVASPRLWAAKGRKVRHSDRRRLIVQPAPAAVEPVARREAASADQSGNPHPLAATMPWVEKRIDSCRG